MFRSIFNGALRRVQRVSLGAQKQALIASSLLGASIFLKSRSQHSVFASSQPTEQSAAKQSAPQVSVNWVTFSDESYEAAVKEGKNVIIILEPSRFKESFLDELYRFMENVNAFQSMIGGTPIVFMKLEFSEAVSPSAFMSKYNVEIEEETLFLFRNQFLDMSSFSFSDYFSNKDSVVKYFRDVPTLNTKNSNEFKSSLEHLNSDTTLMIAYCPESDPLYPRLKERLGALMNLKQYSDNKNVKTNLSLFLFMPPPNVYFADSQLHFLLLNDIDTAQSIGLGTAVAGDLHMAVRKSKMSYNTTTHEINGTKMNIRKYASLRDKMSDILTKATETYNEMNVFAGKSFDVDAPFSFVLEIDENRVDKTDRKKLIKLMSDCHKHFQANEPQLLQKFQFVYVKRVQESQNKWSIYVRDDLKYGQKIRLHSISTQEQLQKMNLTEDDAKPHSYQYAFPAKKQNPTVDSVTEWIKAVQTGVAKESFKTQEKPNYRKYSKKLVSKTFEDEVQKNDRDQAVFFYSKHCHACKQYGSFYENLGLEHLRKDPFSFEKIIEFNRMNSDRNTLKTTVNYPYTPVFMLFKKNFKEHPYVYRSDKFTPKLLKDFLEVTSSFDLIDPKLIDKAVTSQVKIDINQYV